MIQIGLILIFLVGLLSLYFLHKKGYSFSKRVFIALGMGVILGVVLQFILSYDDEHLLGALSWLSIVGVGYVKLLQMIAMPLIFISIIIAFTKMPDGKKTGKVTALILSILLGTTAIAAAIAIGVSGLFQLDASSILQGEAEVSRGEAIVSRSETVVDRTIPDQIIDFFPANPFLDLTGARPTSTIAVVIFATFIGLALLKLRRKQPDVATQLTKGFEWIYALVMEIVRMVLLLTPYGIFAMMTKTTATSNLDAILQLGQFVLASYVAILLMFGVHFLLLMVTGMSPVQFFKKSAETLLFAFTSRSSAGALPMNIHTQTEKLGVSHHVANLSASLGLSIGQNGCAGIYPAMLAVMIAPTVGIDPFTPGFIFTLIAIVMISSFGVAGVGGGATFAAILVLSALDLPIALAGLLISVEPLIDMGRTALNVSGSMTAGIVTGKVMDEIDLEQYQSNE